MINFNWRFLCLHGNTNPTKGRPIKIQYFTNNLTGQRDESSCANAKDSFLFPITLPFEMLIWNFIKLPCGSL